MVRDRDLDHRAEIVIVFSADADITRIDPILGERPRARRIFLQQDVPVVVEVADDRYANAFEHQRVGNIRYRARSIFIVHRNAHQL